MKSIMIEAVFDGAVLRPVQPLNLVTNQRVSLIVEVPEETDAWPSDVASIYQELASEDRRYAANMWSTVQQTWPGGKESP